jgi:hypothetical protein
MTTSDTGTSSARILVRLNSLNTDTSMSITHILVRLNNMNTYSSMSMVRILVRLRQDSLNQHISTNVLMSVVTE